MNNANDSKRPASSTQRGLGWFLLILAGLNVLACGVGAWGVGAAGPELFGDDIMAGTAFDDKYWLTAIALGVVGVVNLVAVIAHFRRSPWWGAAHAVAGLTMMIFIFVEVLIIDEYFFLQPLFFGIGVLQLCLSPIMLGLLPSG